MAYPEDLLTEDERVLRDFHPHWRVLLPVIAWTLVGVAVIVAAWVIPDDNAVVGWLGTALGVATLLGLALPPLARWLFTQYVLTTERIVVRTGIVSRQGTEIPLENINDVHFSQSVIERLLGYGDVILESAGMQGQSELHDIPDPEAFQSAIYRAREDRSVHIHGGGHGGGEDRRDPVSRLEALADLHDRGAITDAEYEAKKQRLLDEI